MAGKEKRILASPDDDNLSRREFVTIASTVASASALAGCSTGDPMETPTSGGNDDGDGGGDTTDTPTAQPQEGGRLVTTLESPIQHLDPHFTGQLAAHIVGNRIQEPLMKINRDLQLEGLLAKDLKVSNDGLTYTITLREGVQFHPPFKREMTADDVIYNFDRIAGEDSSSLWKLNFQGVAEYRAVDDYTVELTMNEVHSSFREWLGNMGINILSPEALEEYGDAKEHPVGTGPFKFEEWASREHITLSGFDDYWRENIPYLDELVFRPMSEPSSKVTELRNGNIHMIRSTPPEFIPQIENDEDLTFDPTAAGGYALLLVNTSESDNKGRAEGLAISNRKVRQAVQEAVDRQSMVDVALGGHGRPTQSWWPPESPWGIDYAPYEMGANPEGAQQLLEESSVETPVPINIVSSSDDPELSQVARIVQENLNQAGFEANLNEFSIGTATQKLYTHQYDLYVNAVGYIISPDIVYAFLHPDMIYQQPYDQNPDNYHEEVYGLFEEADSTLGIEERKSLYADVQRKLIDDSAQVVLYHGDHLQSYSNSVKDYEPHPFLLNFDIEGAWLQE